MAAISFMLTIIFKSFLIVLLVVVSASLLSVLETIIAQKYYELKVRKDIKRTIKEGTDNIKNLLNDLFDEIMDEAKDGIDFVKDKK